MFNCVLPAQVGVLPVPTRPGGRVGNLAVQVSCPFHLPFPPLLEAPVLTACSSAAMTRELDYNREAANAAKFKALFLQMPEIYVPEVYMQYTTTGVRATASLVLRPITHLMMSRGVCNCRKTAAKTYVGNDDGMD